jgi:hypothetical protein
MREGGLIYLWRNLKSPGDGESPNGEGHGAPWVIDTFYPYFQPLNGTWYLNPDVVIEPVSLVSRGRWLSGRVDILQRRNL